MTVTIKHEGCIKCGGCASVCPTGALELVGDRIVYYPEKCIHCGLCAKVCPANVITMTKPSDENKPPEVTFSSAVMKKVVIKHSNDSQDNQDNNNDQNNQDH